MQPARTGQRKSSPRIFPKNLVVKHSVVLGGLLQRCRYASKYDADMDAGITTVEEIHDLSVFQIDEVAAPGWDPVAWTTIPHHAL